MAWTEASIRRAYHQLTPSERAEVDRILAAPEPLSFRRFVSQVNSRYVWYRWCEVLGEQLQAIADGEINRLMVWAPPRHGKSELAIRLFSAYWLYRYPETFAAILCHSAQLAYKMSRASRDYYRASVRLDGATSMPSREAAAVSEWETTRGGGLWATGVSGDALGKGANLLLFDDPLKGGVETSSEVIREAMHERYSSTLRPRLEPDGSIVVIQSRFHEDDLCGRLLERERQSEAPEGWTIIDLPIFAGEQKVFSYPDSCTVIDDWREAGDPLCPERYDRPELEQLKAGMTAHWWSAQFEQRPQPREGGLFQQGFFEVVDDMPTDAKGTTVIRYWDMAGTDSTQAAFTAGCKLTIGKDGFLYILHMRRGQWSPGERDRRFVETVKSDGKAVAQYVEQEPGSAGKDAIRAFAKLVQGYSVRGDRPTGPKEQRWDILASHAEVNGVRLVRGGWVDDFRDELCALPNGRFVDQADAAAGGYIKLSGRRRPVDLPPVKW